MQIGNRQLLELFDDGRMLCLFVVFDRLRNFGRKLSSQSLPDGNVDLSVMFRGDESAKHGQLFGFKPLQRMRCLFRG